MHRCINAMVVAVGLPFSCAAFGQVVLFDNGGLVTTPNPACVTGTSTASQLQSAGGFPNGWIGWGHQLTPTADNRIADDFTITDPNGWTISSIEFYDYQTGAPNTVSPITGVNVRIWSGRPGDAGSTVVWGNTSINRLLSSVFTDTYRISGVCSLNRAIFRSTVNVTVTLPQGTYWLDWQAIGNAQFSGPWAPPVTVTGLRGKPGANAIQFESADGLWEQIFDTGPSPDFSSPPVAQDFPFQINGIVNTSSCYANCDQSTNSPILTANDFQCFLNRYVNGDPYANCDESTIAPVLTANDFQCFLNKYTVGCS